MDAYRIEDRIAQASIGMTSGKHLRIENGRGIEVSVAHGSVWITQYNDPNDICLDAGESFRIDRDGVTMMIAVQASLCTLTLPAAKTRELHVSMVAAGAEPVELFTAGAHAKARRFDAWLDRFRVWQTAAVSRRLG